jgi:hypothetical protein
LLLDTFQIKIPLKMSLPWPLSCLSQLSDLFPLKQLPQFWVAIIF